MTQSSYLISFIRNLMEHSSRDVREKKQHQLEEEFKQTGLALNSCLSEKYEDVTKILNIYNYVSERISANLTALSKMKRDLIDCKSLLYCNREELRRLWLALVEERHCIDLVDMLDRLQSAPDAITMLVGARAWPEATDLTLYTAELLRSEIAVVPALSAIKAELALKNKAIADQLKRQLYSLIYDRPFALSLETMKAIKEQTEQAKRDAQISDQTSSETNRPGSRFSALPLASWHSSTVAFPVVNPNLRKDPLAVAQLIAANLAAASTGTPSQFGKTTKFVPIQSDSEWIQEIVAVVHCLARLEKLPQILASWAPQPNLSRMQQTTQQVERSAFSGRLIPGQGLLGDLHRYIVVKAISAVEGRAIAQGVTQPLPEVADPRFLVMLLHLVFDALFVQARACMLVIRAMKEAQASVLSSFRGVGDLTSKYIWDCVQHEIQLLLAMHLTSHPSTEGGMINLPRTTEAEGLAVSAASPSTLGAVDLNNLLGRKRTTAVLFTHGAASSRTNTKPRSDMPPSALMGNATSDSKRTSNELFSFSNTSHSQSMSTYMREHRALHDPDAVTVRSATESVYSTVCAPQLDNIIHVYQPVMRFIEAGECEMKSEAESHLGQVRKVALSELRNYLKTFVQNVYLPEKLNTLRTKLQDGLNAPDSLNTTVSQLVERELGLARPILSIVLTFNECLLDVKKMFSALPDYSKGVLKIATTLLNEFVSAMWHTYQDVSQVDSVGTTTPSADWAKDDDVSRFWKEFPVWQRMAAHEAHLLAHNLLMAPQNESAKPTRHSSSSTEQHKLAPNPPDNQLSSSTAVALGLYSQLDRSTASAVPTGDFSLNAQLVIPFAEGQDAYSSSATAERTTNFGDLSRVLHEREATRLAARETKKLLDMIKDELPDDKNLPKDAPRHLPTLKSMQLFKILGRLSESLSWLSYRVLNLNTWFCNTAPSAAVADSQRRVSIWETPLSRCAQELTRLSEACLLMIYLEVRIQAYNHLGGLPEGVVYWCPIDDGDVDRYVMDFFVYLEKVQDMLVRTINRHKFRFIFDGLGDFIAQLLLRLIPRIPRMNGNGLRKMCRNVYRLQQALTSLTESQESDLIRVKQLFEMFTLTPEAVIDRLMEEGVAFDGSVYQDLMRLYQRSHPTYSYAKTEECISKVQTVVNRSAL